MPPQQTPAHLPCGTRESRVARRRTVRNAELHSRRVLKPFPARRRRTDSAAPRHRRTRCPVQRRCSPHEAATGPSGADRVHSSGDTCGIFGGLESLHYARPRGAARLLTPGTAHPAVREGSRSWSGGRATAGRSPIVPRSHQSPDGAALPYGPSSMLSTISCSQLAPHHFPQPTRRIRPAHLLRRATRPSLRRNLPQHPLNLDQGLPEVSPRTTWPQTAKIFKRAYGTKGSLNFLMRSAYIYW